ncbi:sialidase family protein [Nocardioides daejeonensis]|uniref:sialidase family protein n=1 Tax=Nocardioides daejeonensis TaxID=1046556 RepID=UPI000D74FDB6|nr:sialidase family protein [Nocardioides daejeonensis]
MHLALRTAALLVALLLPGAGLTPIAPAAPASRGPSAAACDYGVQRTTAYRARGGEKAPVAVTGKRKAKVCEDGTGVLGQEPMLAVNRRGTIFLGMASKEGVLTQAGFLTGTAQSYLLRSRNDGRSWQRIALPRGINTSEGVPYVDPATDRLWVTSTNLGLPCGAPVAWSDDEGVTWRTAKKRPGCQPLSGGDWPKLFTGPYRKTAEVAAGSMPRRAVYLCNYIPSIWVAVTIACWRSDDSGETFGFLGNLPVRSLVCRSGETAGGSFHTIVHGTGQVLRDGTVVVPVDMCGTIIALRSIDNGRSWTSSSAIGKAGSVRNFLDGSAESLAQNVFMNMFFDQTLAQDDRGNLYVGWVRDGVHLAVSRDGGKSWRQLGRVSPPQVKGAVNVSVTARGRGEVALAWWGTEALTDPLLGFGEKYRGWMTHSRNALAKRPVFSSAATSAAKAPPQITNATGCCASLQMFIEYSGVRFTGKRQVRAAFVRFHRKDLPELVYGRMQLPRRG